MLLKIITLNAKGDMLISALSPWLVHADLSSQFSSFTSLLLCLVMRAAAHNSPGTESALGICLLAVHSHSKLKLPNPVLEPRLNNPLPLVRCKLHPVNSLVPGFSFHVDQQETNRKRLCQPQRKKHTPVWNATDQMLSDTNCSGSFHGVLQNVCLNHQSEMGPTLT
jgi:hypothetical protein